MLLYRLLDDCEGLMLIGDCTSLMLLRQVVRDVNDRSPLLTDREGYFVGLAHEAGKAYQGKRELLPPPDIPAGAGGLCGAEISWLALLAQQKLLRLSLAYIDHGKRHQAITYALEAVVEDGLKEAFGDDAAENILCQLDAMGVADLENLPDSYERFMAWNAQQRRDHLIDLLVPGWISSEANPD